MKNRYSREFQPAFIKLMAEYSDLGLELKTSTRIQIAEKFNVSVHLLTGIKELDLDDFRLIKDLLSNRRKNLERRAILRAYLHP